ncbi:hypothetical protein RZS08_30410, partial [Arthrospira platensis SPKY1]|nr:hypothetical protein [Arthrospira platensis SPKY1]
KGARNWGVSPRPPDARRPRRSRSIPAGAVGASRAGAVEGRGSGVEPAARHRLVGATGLAVGQRLEPAAEVAADDAGRAEEVPLRLDDGDQVVVVELVEEAEDLLDAGGLATPGHRREIDLADPAVVEEL